MALSLLDFTRRRKLAVLLLVVIIAIIALFYYSRSHSLWHEGGQSSAIDVDESSIEHLAADLAGGLEKGRRTTTVVETLDGGGVDFDREETPKDVPRNKGNLVHGLVDEIRPPGNEDNKKKDELDYPEEGEEIKPVIGDSHKSKLGEESLGNNGPVGSEHKVNPGAELNGDKHDSDKLNDGERQPKSDTGAVDRRTTVNHEKPATVNKSDSQPHTFKFPKSENVYVHSSMPLGPALKVHHTERQRAVVKAFKHAWSSYRTYAWGHDDLLPLSKSHSSVDYGMAMTMVDSLDTLWLMGLQEEFDKARDWIDKKLNFDNNHRAVIVFEVNIRVMGGLLSAYHLSGDEMFLKKAVSLGERLMPTFATPSGLPMNRLHLNEGSSPKRNANYGSINLAEAGSLQLEFRDLSQATGDDKYRSAVDRTSDVLYASSNSGLYPQFFSVSRGSGSSSTYTVGSGADSFYEYLLKQWLQSNKTESKFLHKYLQSSGAIKNYLVGYTKPSSLPFLGVKSGSIRGGVLMNTMEHLACFYPGTLALGLINSLHPDQRTLAEGLTRSCYVAYNSTRTGLAADSFVFNTSPHGGGDYARSAEEKNIQRPETVESLFLMYRLTKDKKYRDWGWKIFKAFDSNMKVEGGYSGISSVNMSPPPRINKMESFFLAETLKYLFLLFGDNDSVASLDEWVFNTEAHLLPIWTTRST